jgi:hypothetical protein
MVKPNQYPEGFKVERIPPVSDKERQELRRKAKAVGRVSVRRNTSGFGKRGGGIPPSLSNNSHFERS